VADTTVGIALESCLEQSSPADPSWLVEGLRAGTPDAYETLITRYQQPVYNLVYRLMNDAADTSDVVQEVFLKVFRNIGSFRGGSSLKAWIYRIAVNEAYNRRRWFSRHKRKEVGLEAEEGSARSYEYTLCDPGRSPFELAADVELRSMVERALTEVNPIFRPAVVLRDIEGMSYDEIADVLGVSLGTVKSRIQRGREALREALADRISGTPVLEWKTQTAE
jgi:RNA polymerase sigma-70 factor (ECF subfamily)